MCGIANTILTYNYLKNRGGTGIGGGIAGGIASGYSRGGGFRGSPPTKKPAPPPKPAPDTLEEGTGINPPGESRYQEKDQPQGMKQRPGLLEGGNIFTIPPNEGPPIYIEPESGTPMFPRRRVRPFRGIPGGGTPFVVRSRAR